MFDSPPNQKTTTHLTLTKKDCTNSSKKERQNFSIFRNLLTKGRGVRLLISSDREG